MGSILIIAQFVISAIFIYAVARLGAFPVKYLAVIVLIILLFAELVVTGLVLGRKRKFLRGISCFLSILFMICLSFGSAYAWKSDTFIKDVGTETEEKYSAAVIVSADSSYEKIEDLPGVRFAYVKEPVSVYVEECVREVKSMLGPMKAEHADNVSDLADLLYEGKCDAIIIDEATRAHVVETHPDFEEKTRTIWALNVKHTIPKMGSEKDVTRESFNIYLLGSDSRTGVDSAAMNDVNMIVTVNPTTNQILITSIPRDFYISLASYNGSDKLSNIGVYGTEESIRTIEQFTGLTMDFYVKVGFDALVYMVDAIGGIDVESDTEFTAWTNPDVHIAKGVNHMDGVTALAYARERYAYENGDIHRAQNQAQVMREIAWKAMSPALIVHYPDMLDALAKGMRTSMRDDQIRSLIRMQMNKMANWDIRDFQMNGTDAMSKKCYSMPKTELYVMIPDQESVDSALKLIQEFMNGETEAVSDN
ncbi:MAG: LCP family protein [Mogibacterium sp.]|nr:LCP family protein [Mogibacterium sp.]